MACEYYLPNKFQSVVAFHEVTGNVRAYKKNIAKMEEKRTIIFLYVILQN